MCIVCIANNINRKVYMYLDTRSFLTTGYARVLLFMFIRRELEGTGTVCLFQFMLRLHYVPGGHGNHYFGHRGRNGVTVTQRRGTGSTNVARRGRRDHRDKFLNSQKICHGSHGAIDLLKCALVERGERNKT